MKYYTDEFLEGLSDDPIEGVLAICNFFVELRGDAGADDSLYLEAIGLLETYSKAYDIKLSVPTVESLSNDEKRNIIRLIQEIRNQFYSQAIDIRLKSNKEIFSAKLGKAFHYELTGGDLKRIQQLINELREIISGAEQLEENHKSRILKKLEKLQGELHKRMSDLDRFWGLIGEAGVVAGKLGRDAKPIVDRIREIAGIIWRTQAKTEELSSDAKLPFLIDKEDDE